MSAQSPHAGGGHAAYADSEEAGDEAAYHLR